MRHLLVTNDFPPKMGGIQSYLWELWRRLPPEDVAVLTTPFAGADAWDASQPYRIVRTREPVLLPTPMLERRIESLAAEHEAGLVVLDPAMPVGLLGPHLRRPYAIVVHGAEVTVPGRLPVSGQVLGHVLRHASLVISAGGYPLAEAERAAGRTLPSVVVPPGVDTTRFHPLTPDERSAARARFELPDDRPVVLGLSRLVPRKGFDVVIRAAARLTPGRGAKDPVVAIAGGGRDRDRLERVASETAADVRFLGRVDDDDVADLYGCVDVFAMLCRDRWLGLEQEGFGIVFLEAAACAVPQLAGASGGSAEAVVDGVTGFVVDPPTDVTAAAVALEELVVNRERAAAMGTEARARAESEFDYAVLARRLGSALDAVPPSTA